MPSLAGSGAIFTTGLLAVATAGAAYVLCVAQRVAIPNAHHISRTHTVPESFTQSTSIRRLVNPRGHQAAGDTHAITLELPPGGRDVPDKVLLSRFIRSVFGGLVLGPERVGLRALGRLIVDFPQAPPQSVIWHLDSIPGDELPPLHSALIGAFQILDIQLEAEGATPGSSESRIDLGFGAAGGQFCGMHRLVVARSKEHDGSDAPSVQLRFESTNCNPTTDQTAASKLLLWFHDLYTELLFREAVWYVQKSLR